MKSKVISLVLLSIITLACSSNSSSAIQIMDKSDFANKAMTVEKPSQYNKLFFPAGSNYSSLGEAMTLVTFGTDWSVPQLFNSPKTDEKNKDLVFKKGTLGRATEYSVDFVLKSDHNWLGQDLPAETSVRLSYSAPRSINEKTKEVTYNGLTLMQIIVKKPDGTKSDLLKQ